ncbi:hypothetical protein EDD18DRAFT_147823 [Armillaria luteobubalina]|uniref:Uncharacterized protein n=1 Tax=Armillaria luteobubalina TaxID=153913 RepID=A0AA39Q6U1_9AGAR|nr:hypothetical protein EDD18DRAFT_147823 [Armillaria luteobubalina]
MNPHSSDEDDDAPEAVSLSQSKKLIQQKNSSIRQFENVQKEKKRAKNRERDRKLKEQAQGRKKGNGKGKEKEKDEDEDEESSGDEGDDDAISRMRRAMKEAGEESDEDMDAEMHDEDDEGDEEEERDEEEEEFHGFDAPRKSNHLPDHLFASAAASVPSIEKKTKLKSSKEAEKTRKRKRSTAKDRLLGSRFIRALPDPNKPPSGTPSMVPTAKVRKFLDRSLSFKKADKRVGGWERRSANIGSMKMDHGPAAHFVRQQS